MEYMALKIAQVTPGMIPIPPNGWGAVEKIIWNYKLSLERMGHQVDIRYLNEVEPGQYDIVHTHIANLALEAHAKGIPYIFSLHDHHVVHYGVGSFNYNQNLEAIKNSVISITHAEFLIEHFPDTDKLFYLPHGVDINYFKPDNREKIEHKLLCLANNGLAGNSAYDRKGFLYAIDAAKALNLPITVAGPENNLEFFKHYPEYTAYEKLTLKCSNPTEDEILELYRDHTIFLHPSVLEAGHPNLTILEALACGIPVVGTYDGSKAIDGVTKIQRDKDSVIRGIVDVSNNYDEIVESIEITRQNYNWDKICSRLSNMYESVKAVNKEFSNNDAKQAYIDAYKDTNIQHKDPTESLDCTIHFVNGPFIEVKGNTNKTYKIQWLDENNQIHYEEDIKCGVWVKLNRKYYTKWTCRLLEDNKIVFNYTLNLENQRVLIGFDSKSLGDTLAWFPYVEEFRKKHNCKVIASTFWNYLFKNKYPEIEFIEPGEVAHNLIAKYDIGWYYNKDMEPVLPNTVSLQQAATNILGLEYKEVLPNLDFTPKERPYKEKYVTIATASTAGLKYWTREGWEETIKFLKQQGYRVIHISKESTDLDVEQLQDTNIENTMNVLHHSEFFIGLSSGLSWLAWALRKKTIMISNFTEADHEFSTNCIRITDTNVCHGCWNKAEYTFDKGDWNWCPVHKGTDRQFECHKSITSNAVIDKIKILI